MPAAGGPVRTVRAAEPGSTIISKGTNHVDQTAIHRQGDCHRRSQRPLGLRRRVGQRHALGAEGDGRSWQAGTTTPEHLFATGYAACFGGALDFIAKQHKKDASGATITCAVTIGPRDAGGFGLAVKMLVVDKTLPQSELQALANEAHEKICPYSHATRNNVDVDLTVEGA